MNIRRQLLTLTVLATCLLLFAACRSTRMDWGNRVGNYTYDEAVVELGLPDKMAMLSDQSKVAEWFSRGDSGMSVGLGTGISRGPVGAGVGVPVYRGSGSYLQLTFGPDGILRSWKR